MARRKIVYLAGPYSHADPRVREQRYEELTATAAWLVKYSGYIVFSPITLTHPLEAAMGSASTFSDPNSPWLEFDQPFMKVCDVCCVLTLPGWRESAGVKHEIEWFESQGRPVWYLEDISLF